MRPTDLEPVEAELEALLDDEDRALLEKPEIPEEEKTEIDARLEAFRENDLGKEESREAQS